MSGSNSENERLGSESTKVGFGRRAARGAATTAAGQAAKFALQITSVIVLAHLLSPTDFGLVAMVIAVTAIGEVLRDFGLSSAAIQATAISARQRSNLFWLNLLIGGLLTCVCLVAAPLVADLYSRSEVVPIMQALAGTFLLSGASTQFRAHLIRNLRFTSVMTAEVLSMVLAIATGIILAVAGAGYWSIVAQQLVQAAVLLLMVAAAARWIPGPPTRHAGMRELINFGWNLMGAQLLQYLSRNVGSIVVGAQFGAAQLGYYNRASQLITNSLNQINVPASTVALPVLSRLNGQKDRWSLYILRGQELMLAAVIPIFAYCAAFSHELVPAALGTQWTGSITIFRFLAIAALFQAASYATYWVFVSTGNTKALLNYSLATRIIAVGLIVCAGFFSADAVALAYAAGTMCFWPMGLLWVRRVAQAPSRKMAVSGIKTIVIYGGAACIAATAAWYLGLRGWPALLVGLTINIVVLVTAFVLIPQYRSDINNIKGVVGLVRQRGDSPDVESIPSKEVLK